MGNGSRHNAPTQISLRLTRPLFGGFPLPIIWPPNHPHIPTNSSPPRARQRRATILQRESYAQATASTTPVQPEGCGENGTPALSPRSRGVSTSMTCALFAAGTRSSVEIVPCWTDAKSLDQKIDQHTALRGEISVGGINSVDAKLCGRVVRKHDLQPAGLYVRADEKCRKLGDASASNSRRSQDVAVVRAQHRADRYTERLTVFRRQLPSLQYGGVAISQTPVRHQILRHRRPSMLRKVAR